MKGQHLPFVCLRRRFIFLVLICLCYCLSVSGQYELQFLSAGVPVEHVMVFDNEQKNLQYSDAEGKLSLTNDFKFPATCHAIGFKEIKLTLDTLQELDFVIEMEALGELLEELVLIGRTDVERAALSYETAVVDAQQIILSNAQTSADILSSNSNVYIQKSQMGGGSPVLRGFEANKLLLVVDGVRMNNAIYRSGHLQNAITVDALILESSEVVFGPNALMYGSDALGGVVHFRSKTPDPKAIQSSELNSLFRYGSSNHEKTGHLDYSYVGKGWTSLSSISYSKYEDLNIGKRRAKKYEDTYGQRLWYVKTLKDGQDSLFRNAYPNTMRFSGFSQYQLLQKFTFELSPQWKLSWNNQWASSSNIPRYDALTEQRKDKPRYALWDYGPQRRLLSSLNLKYTLKHHKWLNQIKIVTAYQSVGESRIVRAFGKAQTQYQIEDLDILNFNVDFKGQQAPHYWYGGIESHFNSLDSQAKTTDFKGKEQLTGASRYPNDLGRTWNTGAYLQYHYIPARGIDVHGGIRYDYNRVKLRFDPKNTAFDWPAYFYSGIHNSNSSVNGALGLKLKLNSKINWSLSAASAFRAPNIDDLAKVRLKRDEISIPNAKLAPERSLNFESGLQYHHQGTHIGITAFYTRMYDAIVRAGFQLPSGNPFHIVGQDSFRVVANQNAEQARIQGLSINTEAQISTELSLSGSLSFIRGDRLGKSKEWSPLGHIPPTYGRVYLKYKAKRLTGQLGTQFNAKKPIERFGGSVDNPEFATEQGSLSWYILNTSLQYTWTENLRLQVGIDNILDTFYIPFSSGIPGAGRHFSITLLAGGKWSS